MLEIIQHPNNILCEKAAEIPVGDISSNKIQTLISEMKEALEKEQLGVAIAAPQVGKSLKLFVVSGKVFAANEPDKEYDPSKYPNLVCINPLITKTSKSTSEMHEGCLSVRGKWGKVMRAEKATLEAYNEKGEKISRGASGLLAQIFQHEMDHLDGILYLDKAVEVWDDACEEKEEKNEKE